MLTGSITIFDRKQNVEEREAIAEQQRIVYIDADGLHVRRSDAQSEVLIDQDSVDVRVDGSTFSSFGVDNVSMGNYKIRQAADGGLSFDYISGGFA